MAVGNSYDVSVVISTYNRGSVLPRTIESLLEQEACGTRYEIVVVDNNSTDTTQHAITPLIARGCGRLRLVFEPRRGVSHGRNTGIRASVGRLVAFTDDDVSVDRRWVANIRRAFDEHPEVDYVTGRVLPAWERQPPDWLTPETWGGPCVLRDRGDAPIFGCPGAFFPGWATANLALRRELLERVGLFSGDFERGEDLEFILRVWRAGGRGMYAPDVLVTHRVPEERMTKAYHRMWHEREGEIRARLGFKEIFEADGRITGEREEGRMFLGTAAFVYRELLRDCRHWAVATICRRRSQAFKHECRIRQSVSYIRRRLRSTARLRQRQSAVSCHAPRIGTGG